ncbi:hypothetical protein ABBQ32_006174 [Trebouxia sp. C0010 RCD-2024]
MTQALKLTLAVLPGLPTWQPRQTRRQHHEARCLVINAAREANDGTSDDGMAESAQLVRWQCHDCGCKWTSTPKARVTKRMCGCPQCAAAKKEMKKG